jgi:WD40 associated region in TFIID subunit, NTD2 domain
MACSARPKQQEWTVSPPAQVLYPLFVYAYLDVVRKGHGARAREMMRKLKARFVDAGGASVSVASELDDLATVVYPQHLQNPVPRQVRRRCHCHLA